MTPSFYDSCVAISWLVLQLALCSHSVIVLSSWCTWLILYLLIGISWYIYIYIYIYCTRKQENLLSSILSYYKRSWLVFFSHIFIFIFDIFGTKSFKVFFEVNFVFIHHLFFSNSFYFVLGLILIFLGRKLSFMSAYMSHRWNQLSWWIIAVWIDKLLIWVLYFFFFFFEKIVILKASFWS